MPEEKKEKVVETSEKEKTAETSVDEQIAKLVESQTNFESRVTKLLDGLGTERGNDRKEREDLLEKLGSIEEKMSVKEVQETEFDPYNKEQLKEMFSDVVDEIVKPLKESQELFMTRDGFSEMLQVAATGASLKKDFKLKDEEVEELNAEAQEKGLNVEHLAFQKYGDRRFKKNVNAELAEEMKNKDTGQPEETVLDAEYKKVGIPKDHHEFNKSFREKGSDATKQALLTADKAAGV